MDLEKFREDVYEITEKLSQNLHKDDIPKLNYVRQKLIEMYKKNLVKINHSVLELICASNLISRGYAADIEKSVSDILVCDIFAKKNSVSTIIEIETGFTPPDHALDTINYYVARIISKIARYSPYCSRFSLATPVIGILPIPKIFLILPNSRDKIEIEKAQNLCNRYYKNPPIKYDEILNAKLHSIYLIHIDKGFSKELDPNDYLELSKKLLEKSGIDP